MSVAVDLQLAYRPDAAEWLPSAPLLQRWTRAAIGELRTEAELTIRIVGMAESAELNSAYRHKQGPTNVLSFPFEAPPGLTLPLLGDLVICAPVVAQEALAQGKTAEAHWAHMVIHGTLHLLGYDHMESEAAEQMEALETEILTSLGYRNPYHVDAPE